MRDNLLNVVVVLQVRNVQRFRSSAEQPLRPAGSACEMWGFQSQWWTDSRSFSSVSWYRYE